MSTVVGRSGLFASEHGALRGETLTRSQPRALGERQHLLTASDDRCTVVSDQAMSSGARDARDRSGNRSHRAVEVSGLLGDAQRSRTHPGLDDDRCGRHCCQESGALNESPPGRCTAGRDLAGDRATGGDVRDEFAMTHWIGAIHAAC